MVMRRLILIMQMTKFIVLIDIVFIAQRLTVQRVRGRWRGRPIKTTVHLTLIEIVLIDGKERKTIKLQNAANNNNHNDYNSFSLRGVRLMMMRKVPPTK